MILIYLNNILTHLIQFSCELLIVNQVQIFLFIHLIPTIMKTIHTLNSNRPKIGDKKHFFGKLFIWSGNSWSLNDVCKDVISPKNVENSGYRIHSYSM